MATAAAQKQVMPGDAPALYDLQKKVSDQNVRIRSAAQNLTSFSAFLEEADSMIGSLPDGDAKEEWKRRSIYCRNSQIPAEVAAKDSATSLLSKYQAALDVEKAKYDPSLAWSGEFWTVQG